MKAIFSKLIQNYNFSPTRFIFGGIVLLGILTYSFCDSTVRSSYERNGKTCYYCPPGFHWTADCVMTETQALCAPCPSGYFQNSENVAGYCGMCTKCYEIIRNHDLSVVHVLAPCTATSDTVCGCKATYHLVLDSGGDRSGYCQKNSMCPAGKGLHKDATNYTDNVCENCIDGFTYSTSSSLQPCVQCTTSCPNNTHVKNACNTTHDTICEEHSDFVGPSQEIIPGEDNHHTHLRIGIGIAAAASVVLAFGIFITYICRRSSGTREPSDESIQRPEHIITYCARSPPNIPNWMKPCVSGNTIDWEKLFALCYSRILPDWEAFVRNVFVLSENGEKGQPSIEEAKEAFNQEKVQSRIYHALTLWKQKCFIDNELTMIHNFCEALEKHQQIHNKRSQ